MKTQPVLSLKAKVEIFKDLIDGRLQKIHINSNKTKAQLISQKGYCIIVPINDKTLDKEPTEEQIKEQIGKTLLNSILKELGNDTTRYLQESLMDESTNIGLFTGNLILRLDDFPPRKNGALSVDLDNILYAMCVTEMEAEKFGKSAALEGVLSSIYNLDYGRYANNGEELIHPAGNARKIAKRIPGYAISSNKHSRKEPLSKKFEARLYGINMINLLYFRMVTEGFISKSLNESMNTEDRFELVCAHIRDYVDQIIQDTIVMMNNEQLEDIHEILNLEVSEDIISKYIRATRAKKALGRKIPSVNPEPLGDAMRAINESQARNRRKLDSIQGRSRMTNADGKTNENEGPNSVIISGTSAIKEGTIEVGDQLFGTTDIGTQRKKQEDGLFLHKDTEIPGFKAMAVADGMGGTNKGEVASNHVLKAKLKNWFESLDYDKKERYYLHISEIEPEIKKLLEEANNEIERVFNKSGNTAGTTIVCAVIGKDETLVVNVGDSRAYMVANEHLEQVTTDDSEVQELKDIDADLFETPEDERFYVNSNVITASIGAGGFRKLHSKILKNDDYDMLLLFSDGVTDCLSEKEIATITRRTDIGELTKAIVNRAITGFSHNPRTKGAGRSLKFANRAFRKRYKAVDSEKARVLKRKIGRSLQEDIFLPTIKRGKDNATATLYVSDRYLKTLKGYKTGEKGTHYKGRNRRKDKRGRNVTDAVDDFER